MLAKIGQIKRLVLLRLNPGDDILLSLRQAVQDHEINTGLILFGIGSSTGYHLHVVKTTNLPPGNLFFKDAGPYDILSLNGFVIDGRVHAHITLSTAEKVMGGHLEEGTQTLTFCLVVLAETPGVDLSEWDSVKSM
jgi:hypothetical protein